MDNGIGSSRFIGRRSRTSRLLLGTVTDIIYLAGRAHNHRETLSNLAASSGAHVQMHGGRARAHTYEIPVFEAGATLTRVSRTRAHTRDAGTFHNTRSRAQSTRENRVTLQNAGPVRA